jgi:hypothetical protein
MPSDALASLSPAFPDDLARISARSVLLRVPAAKLTVFTGDS